MVKSIILTKGQVAIVDDIDFEYLNQWKWQAMFNKSVKGYYAIRSFQVDNECKNILMHRLIVENMLKEENNQEKLQIFKNQSTKYVVDHINHDTLLNTRDNLKMCTARENSQNRKRMGVSKYPGVNWRKDLLKWQSKITIKGKTKHLGYFNNEIDAANAYKKLVNLL